MATLLVVLCIKTKNEVLAPAAIPIGFALDFIIVYSIFAK